MLPFPGLPELIQILPQDSVTSLMSHSGQGGSNIHLKQVFHDLMTCEKSVVAESLNKLLTRLEKEGKIIVCLLYLMVLAENHH